MATFSLLASNLISSNPKTLILSSSLSKNINQLLTISSNSSLFRGGLRRGRSLDLSFVRKVAVSEEYEQDEEVLSADEESLSPDSKVFVGNLPFSVDSAELAGLFDNAGNVDMVEVIYDKLTGKSRGFGFVTMSTSKEAEAAAQQFNGYEFQGRTLRANSGPPPPREEYPSRSPRSGGGGGGGGSFDASNRLYVGNLSWDVDNSALEKIFSEQGKVMDARVVYDRESGRSKGFGFVTFNSVVEANNAISSLDGTDLDGRTIRVAIAEARPPRREF